MPGASSLAVGVVSPLSHEYVYDGVPPKTITSDEPFVLGLTG